MESRMKTKLLHKLRVKTAKHLVIDERHTCSDVTMFTIYYKGASLITEVCTSVDYDKVKEHVFRKCDRLLRESILKELQKYR